MPWARRTSVFLAVLVAGHLAAGLAWLAGAPTGAAWATVVVGALVAVPAAALGVLVTRRREGAVVGTLLGVLALTVAHVVAKEVWLQYLGSHDEVARERAWLVAATAENAWWVLVAVGLLLLFFPDGHLPGLRWGWVPATMVVSGAVTQVYGAFDPAPFRPPLHDLDRPFGPPPAWFELFSLVAFVAMLLLVLACAGSLVLRFRRAGEHQQRQIKWLILPGLGVPLYPLLCLVEIVVWGEPHWVSATVGVASLVAIPFAVALAVLKHDLYDVDKALVLAVTWGLLTAALLTVYAVASSVAGVLAGRDSATVAAIGTATAALALLPLLRLVRGFVDRRMYPLRQSALGAVDALHREVSAGRARPEQLESVLRSALRDPQLRVGYRVPGSDTFLDADGAHVPGDAGVPVLLEEEATGVLVPGRGLASAELLGEVADRSSTLIEVVRLRSEVARALRETELSRQRLVEIGYEERRRMERDLHDGAQQRLVSLGMALRVAQRHLADGSVDVDGLLDQSVAELGSAVAELRQIAHGLRPSSLDDGLPAAVSNLVRSVPLAVEMSVDDAPLPDAVATTAYYVISEAITNAVKHAEATRVVLEVSRRDGQVLVRVTDDGRGGAQLGTGSGIADRVVALGGSLRVLSPLGQGTVVSVEIPCAS